jgi:hypothetical protein
MVKNISYMTNNQPIMLKIRLKAKDARLRLIAQDFERKNTKYLDRYYTLRGTQDFIIRMPISPKQTIITIDSGKSGGNFEIVPNKEGKPGESMRIITQMSAFDFSKPLITKFIIFSQEFANRAGYLSPGIYLNKPSGEYQINYLPSIIVDGKEANTPARINERTGIVEISQKHFIKYTVPARFAILLHEFCHVFSGKHIKGEIEADFFAAQIYLALGFPRVEILNVFANIFLKADNELNRVRLEKFKEYVNEFDNRVKSVKYY